VPNPGHRLFFQQEIQETNTTRSLLRATALLAATAMALTLAACASPPPNRPAGWGEPHVLVAPSSFAGVHGLAIEGQADDIAVGPNGALAWTNDLMGMLRYRANDTAPLQVLAKDLPGLNSVDFDRRNGKLYASQVFLGDALWEIDVAGVKPPRLIAKDMGGFNGFEVGPDGMLYGPPWFKSQVVKIDPANGAITVINSEFKVPSAANLDGKGNLWVVDTRTAELSKVELASGRKTVMKQLKTALDNLAIAPDGTI
jgi:hypothetical protein